MRHARCAPSGASRWLRCPGSVALETGQPDDSSSYAEEGTLAASIAQWALVTGLEVGAAGRNTAMDTDMQRYMEAYVAEIQALAAGRALIVESPLDISIVTGEPGAGGTPDVVILDDEIGEMQVRDLKYGAGVAVAVEGNEQLMIYALAALHQYSVLGEWKTVRLAIHQPRNGGTSEWVTSKEDLERFGEYVRKVAASALDGSGELVPGEKQCRFCKAKAVCPALRNQVIETFESLPAEKIGGSFLVTLNACMNKVGLIETWCLAIRAEAERRLLAGETLADWKLVQGRRGNRTWKDEEAAAAWLLMFAPQDQIYTRRLVSPAQAEKILEHERTAADPEEFAALVTQSAGRPSVAPMSDKRPTLVAVKAEDFDNVA
jgi:hypothetical protein